MSGRQHSLPTNTMKSNATITFLKEVYPEHIMTSKNIDLFGILGLHRVRDRNLTSAEICDKCNPYVLKKDKLRAMNSDKNSKQKNEQLVEEALLVAFQILSDTDARHRYQMDNRIIPDVFQSIREIDLNPSSPDAGNELDENLDRSKRKEQSKKYSG